MATRKPTPLFILGSGRSGTTVTASLLNRFHGVHIAKETGYIGLSIDRLHRTDDPDTLRSLVADVNSWLAKEQWEQVASVDGFFAFCERYQLSGGGGFIHYIWQLNSPVPWHDLEFIGDNTPLYVMAIPAILELLPNARFIHMMRDPRDIVCSIYRMRFGADDLVAAAMEWHLYVGCWLMAERLIPSDRRMECRYEDLCSDAPGTMETLASFLGRDSFEAIEALAAHTSGAADPRFRNVATLSHHTRLSEPLTPERIARFRQELTPDQIRVVEQIAQYGMIAYGYKPTQWQVHPLMREDRGYLLKAMIRDMSRRIYKRIFHRSNRRKS